LAEILRFNVIVSVRLVFPTKHVHLFLTLLDIVFLVYILQDVIGQRMATTLVLSLIKCALNAVCITRGAQPAAFRPHVAVDQNLCCLAHVI